MPHEFGYLEFSRALVILGAGLGLLTILLVVLGDWIQDRRLVLAARRSLVATGGATVGAAIGLVAGFVNGAYDRSYIYDYSERGLPLSYKIAGLWGGLDGSILFWAALIGVVGGIVAYGFRRDEGDREGRRLEPWVYLVFGSIQLFFLVVVAFVTNPFELHSAAFLAQNFPNGAPILDGSGLNPLLVNYWMLIHPPCLYFGWVVYTVPFCFAIAALIIGEQGNYWITKIRRWTMLGWLFNTTGVILGGLWAYVVLGWGGYWAWDPVENASFLPWFASTALLHSIMVQERRGMMRSWNAFLATLVFVLSIFGTYLTRSGIVNSVHAFGSGPVGDWFLGFLLTCIAVCLFLITLRQPSMRSPHRIETLWSREALFVINNFVLLAIASSILILTLWPKISHEFFGQAISVGPPTYNQVTVPFFVLMLLISAVGPALGWIRTSPRVLLRNLLLPALVSVPIAATIQWGAELIRAGETGDLSWAKRIYPTFVVLYSATLIAISLGYEVLRTVQNRSRRTGQGLLETLVTITVRNNRRYGGYFVHVGLAVITTGIVCSSMYRVEREFKMRTGDQVQVGSYEISLENAQTLDQAESGKVFGLQTLEIGVRPEFGGAFRMFPEKRHYPKKNTMVTEVEIHRGMLEDLYVFFQSSGEDGSYNLVIFRNPLIMLVWAGWIMMILGGIFAALPLGRKRVGLAD